MPNQQLVPVSQLESYRKLVTKLAWRTWRMLPMQMKSWIGIDDIIEDGMAKAFRYSIKHFDPNKATFITGLYHHVHNYFIRSYSAWYGNEKRGLVPVEVEIATLNKRTGCIELKTETKLRPIPVVSIDDRVSEDSNVTIGDTIPDMVSEDSILRDVVTDCFVIPAMENVYNNASGKLQEAMVAWFLRSGGVSGQGRVPKNGVRFHRLSGEFRDLCFRHHIVCEDCIHIVRSPRCLDKLSRQLLWIPYDLNNPTPMELERSKQMKQHLL